MTIALDHHIEISPETRGGRPRLAGRRITVADVVVMHLRLGQSLEEIAGKYDLPLAGVHAAMAYYYDNRSAIDESIRSDEAVADAFEQNNPGPLQEKLRKLRGG